MRKILLVYRLFIYFLFALIILGFRVISGLIIKNEVKRQKKTCALIRFLSAKMMKVIACKIHTTGFKKYLKGDQNYLIVANHVSYLDIALLSRFMDRNRFISHLELKENNPLLTWLIKAGGAYLIERRSFKYIRKELKELSVILRQGLNLSFFPEGTSTDGSEIKSFRPLFFTTAIKAEKAILPVCINYKKVNGQDFSVQNRDLICWYDESISFVQHFFRLLQQRSIEVELIFLPPIDSAGKHSRWLAHESRTQIQKHYIGLTSL